MAHKYHSSDYYSKEDLEILKKTFMPIFSPEERLEGLNPEERLEGLGLEDRLRGLSDEELRQLEQFLKAQLNHH